MPPINFLVVCRARHTFLRVSLYVPVMEVKASPKPSQMEAKGIVYHNGVSGDGASEGSGSTEVE